MSLGFDVGTHHLICSYRSGSDIAYKKINNTFAVSKNSPSIIRDGEAYAFGKNLSRRTIIKGKLNYDDPDAFSVLKAVCQEMIRPIPGIIYFSCSDENQKTILSSIFGKYSYPIRDSHALVYAELDQFTGTGICFGAGKVMISEVNCGTEVTGFILDEGGDQISEHVSLITKIPLNIVEEEKKKVDLTKRGGLFEDAVCSAYRTMFEKVIELISGNSPITIAGGVTNITGFKEIFEEMLNEQVIKSENHLLSVVRGCLIAAEITEFC